MEVALTISDRHAVGGHSSSARLLLNGAAIRALVHQKITAVWQNLWVRMALPSSRRSSPLRVATGGDASWRKQDSTEASLYLGNYSIVVKDVNTCFSECSQAGCSKSYSWTARILVIDGLGINPANVGASEEDPDVWKWWEYYILEQNVFGQERAAVVASWDISGKGCCKK